jgi:hypothetical protein
LPRPEKPKSVNYASSIRERCRNLFRYLRDNPQVEYDGRLISDLVVEEAVRRSPRYGPVASGKLVFALARAGYVVEENGELRRALPEIVDLPAADNEVHMLLNRHNLAVPEGHLEQAIDAHTRGGWGAANSQSRSFLESLLDEIAYLLDANAPCGQYQGAARRQLLANLNPAFLCRELNEWSDDGKNFINGAFKRLHPQGAHPGLSDEEDSTFRLHLVVLVSRLLLRRLDARIAGQVGR